MCYRQSIIQVISLLWSISLTALAVMFVKDSYSVGEADGNLSYGLTATGTASFDYEVVITGQDGSAICEYIVSNFDYTPMSCSTCRAHNTCKQN